MKGGRYAVFSNQPGSGLVRQEFGTVGKPVVAYVARKFDDLTAAKEFAHANEDKLGFLRIFDRATNRVVYWPIDLTKAFPASEPLSGLLTRLVVIFADLSLEWPGIGSSQQIKILDKVGEMYRRMHFFRSSTGSLVAARDLLDGLMANPTFRGWLTKEPATEAKFREYKHKFDQRRELFERLRNQMGEHVVEDVGDTVLQYKPGDTAPAEVDEDGALTARLAETIINYAFMPGIAPAQWKSEFEKIINLKKYVTRRLRPKVQW